MPSISLIGRWGKYDISVRIPNQPKWAYDAVVNATETWNAVQLWFKEMYYPNSVTYVFLTQPRLTQADVTVNFTENWINGTDAGLTSPLIFNHVIQSVTVGISTLQPPIMRTIALHEFGHVLGLGHSNYTGDLMDISTIHPNNSPSTLDLYAVHELAEGRVPQTPITLPNGIPYEASPPVSVGGSSATFIAAVIAGILIVTVSVAVVIIQRRNEK
jgi:hypothetical protein